MRQGREVYLTLETAYTELWRSIGRICKLFAFEMDSMTVDAFNIHWAQKMPALRFLIRTTPFWGVPQIIIVIDDLLDMFSFLLEMDLQLLIEIDLVLVFLHLPLIVMLLLQFGQISLILLDFQLPCSSSCCCNAAK